MSLPPQFVSAPWAHTAEVNRLMKKGATGGAAPAAGPTIGGAGDWGYSDAYQRQQSMNRNNKSLRSLSAYTGNGYQASGVGPSGTQFAQTHTSDRNNLGGMAQKFFQDSQGNFYDSEYRPVSAEYASQNKAAETPLWKTEGYSGDSYIRGMRGVDALQAYDAETKRMTLSGLVGGFQAFANRVPTNFGGGPSNLDWHGGAYGGFASPYSQPAAMAPPPPFRGAQTQFGDIFRGMSQGNNVAMARDNNQLYGQYHNRAADAQQQNALGGLNLQARQYQNALGRQSAVTGLMNDWSLW